MQDGVFKFVNSAFCKIIGYEREELLGKKFLPFISPKERERVSEIYKKRLVGEDVPSIYETVGLHKSGIEIPIEINSALTQYVGKTATLVLVRDITDRKKTEKELKEALSELEKAHSELKKLDAVKIEFLNITSHELRSPLTSVLGYAELLSDGFLGSLTDAQNEAVNGILRNSQQLSRLVDDLLDFSSMESGTLRLDLGPCRLEYILTSAVDSMKSIIEEAKCNVQLNISSDLPLVKGDTDRIIQVIYNLIDNAIKFSPEGGTIRIGTVKVDNFVEVYVSDDGIGIPDNEKDKIFDKFYQVDMSDKRRVRGIGLGLAISKAIIEASGGSIWVESEVGKGSTFRFTLPIYYG
ncbi:MAG: ATP-binding protein [bacterium]